MLHSRFGKLLVLVCLLVAGMIIASQHNDAPGSGQSSTTARIVRTILSPFQSVTHSIGRSARDVKLNMRTRGRLMDENKNLRAETRALTKVNARLWEEHSENIRLRQLLELKNSYPSHLVATQIIARGASRWHDTCTIDRGWRDGVHKTDPVITPRGVVGQVIDAGATVSQVILLTDQTCGVGAVVQRPESRATGICQGQQTGDLSMNYIDKDADIRVGDIIVTSGIGQIYPKGLRLGRVIKIHRTAVLKSADIRPSVEFDKLEEAAVIIHKPEN
jgi:rod shape-determining protein MreC